MNIRFHNAVNISIENIVLKGELIIPAKAHGIIVFSHGSGSSRFSKRNQKVAQYLHGTNWGTLLLDLLTLEEDTHYYNRFDIDLLAKRLISSTKWLEKFPAAKDCQIGYFGASTGAASALQAAAQLPEVLALVSRGGRPDLAMDYLALVSAPTLLIVGSLDTEVRQLNKKAYQKLRCIKEMKIVEGASHLFEEEGKMDKVSELASGWFEKYM